MAKTKLRKIDRENIMGEIKLFVSCPKEKRKHDRLMVRAHKALLKYVEEKFPAEDMAVLSKYKKTRLDYCGTVYFGEHNQVVGFNFSYITGEVERSYGAPQPLRCRDDLPIEGFLVPIRICELDKLRVSEKVGSLIEDYNAAQQAHFGALKKKIAMYRTLVLSSRYVEDLEGVVDLSPEFFAELKVRDSGLPSVPQEYLEAIKKDKLQPAAV